MANIKIKTLIKKLKKFNPQKSIRFYFLKGYDLKGCELETIIDSGPSVEITIKEDNTDEGGN